MRNRSAADPRLISESWERPPLIPLDLQFFGDGWKTSLEMLRKWRPGLFCFNDTEATTDEDRALLHKALESLYPGASSFEKEVC